MELQYPDGQPFAVGAIHFTFEPVSQTDANLRIMFPVEFENVQTIVILDTGAPFVICAPEIAKQVGINTSLPNERSSVTIRKKTYSGGMHHINMRFPAEVGESVELPIIAFVPDPDLDPDAEPLPSFIGLTRCLDRIRFAIDPQDQWFFFDEPFDEY